MQTTTSQAPSAAGRENLAVFEVAGRSYALDVGQVREIVRDQSITPLPNAPCLIEGVVELRGAVVPVIDLRQVLEGTPVEPSSRVRIVVLATDGLVFGLRVEAALDVLEVPAAALEAPPTLATHAGYQAVRAVVRRPGASPVLMLNLDHILESIYRSAPRGEGAAS